MISWVRFIIFLKILMNCERSSKRSAYCYWSVMVRWLSYIISINYNYYLMNKIKQGQYHLTLYLISTSCACMSLISIYFPSTLITFYILTILPALSLLTCSHLRQNLHHSSYVLCCLISELILDEFYALILNAFRATYSFLSLDFA